MLKIISLLKGIFQVLMLTVRACCAWLRACTCSVYRCVLGALVVRVDYVSGDVQQEDCVLLNTVKVSKRAHILQMVGQKAAQCSCIRSGHLCWVVWFWQYLCYRVEWKQKHFLCTHPSTLHLPSQSKYFNLIKSGYLIMF